MLRMFFIACMKLGTTRAWKSLSWISIIFFGLFLQKVIVHRVSKFPLIFLNG